jgi:phosphatidylserine/phosphatidylglycerophosphate/cardiolipin synthase-like enzyme
MAARSVRHGITLIMLLAMTTPALPAQPNEAGCPRVTVCFTPGENCTDAIVRALGSAKQTVLAQAYSSTSPPIAKALLDAHTRGKHGQNLLYLSGELSRLA